MAAIKTDDKSVSLEASTLPSAHSKELAPNPIDFQELILQDPHLGPIYNDLSKAGQGRLVQLVENARNWALSA